MDLDLLPVPPVSAAGLVARCNRNGVLLRGFRPRSPSGVAIHFLMADEGAPFARDVTHETLSRTRQSFVPQPARLTVHRGECFATCCNWVTNSGSNTPAAAARGKCHRTLNAEGCGVMSTR